MMRHVYSDQLADFAAIYQQDVEVVSVTRQRSSSLDTVSEELIRSRRIPETRWVQGTNDPDAAKNALSATIGSEAHTALSAEISEASELLGLLTECNEVGIRLETLRAPMCPRFHVDFVHCRMLITLAGAGTDWIPNGDVDWEAFGDRTSTAPPVHADAEIQQLSAGNWSLLKGGKWSDHFDGVVHRSPHDEGERLLLTLDPIS